jgi:hypothetical protein
MDEKLWLENIKNENQDNIDVELIKENNQWKVWIK